MEEGFSATSWLLLGAPTVALAGLWATAPGLREILALTSYGVPAYWSVGLIIGIVAYRKSRSVHDHEWHRARSIKRLERTYRAEDKGLWIGTDGADQRLSERAGEELAKKAILRMEGRIQDINRESGPVEIESKEEDVEQVQLFMEQEHVIRSTARVTGESGPVESVSGITIEREDEPSGGLVSKAMGRLKDARHGAVERAVQRKRGDSGKATSKDRSASVGTIGLSGNSVGSEPYVSAAQGVAIPVQPGQDYDPSPQASMSPTTLDSGWGIPVAAPAPSKRCGECGAGMGNDEVYCPRCGAFSA